MAPKKSSCLCFIILFFVISVAYDSLTLGLASRRSPTIYGSSNSVMGATGTGKSTVRPFQLGCALPSELTPFLPLTPPSLEQFVNLVSGSNLAVSDGLKSCTADVQTAGAFDLDGRRVVLIDTPGFDDTTKSDTDVLKIIAAFLETSYVKLRLGPQKSAIVSFS